MNIYLADLLYPRHCAICDCILGRKEKYLCKKCRSETKTYDGGRCVICGRAADSRDNTICKECAAGLHAFDQAVSPFIYKDRIRSSILRLKYGSRPEYAKFYACMICSSFSKLIKSFMPDCILYVPAHSSRIRKRGYDQAYLIAREVSRFCGIPVEKNIIIRKRRTKALSGLNPEERKAELKKAFVMKKHISADKVILIDDIFTTGASADEVCRLLKTNGVNEILVLTAATSEL